MEWKLFKTVDDRANAELIANRLMSDEVPARIDYGSLEAGLEGFKIYVPAELLHRAKWLLSDAGYTDEELAYLSTGKLTEED